jgi:hypothetical protein
MLDVVSHEWPVGVRRLIGELDLTYYLPCRTRAHHRLPGGEPHRDRRFSFAATTGVLVTISSYVGIAVTMRCFIARWPARWKNSSG